MARLGRAIPNRPIIGRPQLIPVAAAAILRTSYVVRAVDTGRRVRGKATFGQAWKLPTIRATSYMVKPARTGKPIGRVAYGRAKITSVALTPIPRYSYFVRSRPPLRRTWQVKYGRAIVGGAAVTYKPHWMIYSQMVIGVAENV